ncbi:FecCD family ABC transporter permease [Nocardioides sp.]|uniref:FecCD family ABC transporter permease n=1 Tax=Nocardioides sp. TaxID=35761 RepID=UPI003519B946
MSLLLSPTARRRGVAPVLIGPALIGAVVLVVAASLLLGSNPLAPDVVVRALLDRDRDVGAVVWGSRVPRTVLGLVVGACLGAAGAVMQGQTRNPLADPGLFGVSAGASLAVVLGLHVAGVGSVTATALLAMLGALLAATAVFGIAALGRGLASPVPLALAGTAVTALLGAATSYLVLTDETTLAGYRIWVVGSLSGRTLEGLGPVAALAGLGALLAATQVRALDALALGTEVAAGLGQSLLRTRLLGLAAITLLTASAVAVTGPIGFVGLTAPHVARALVGGTHARLLPASAVVGAVVLLACDVVARMLGGLGELSVGVVLSVLGGVVFVAIVRRGRMAEL